MSLKAGRVFVQKYKYTDHRVNTVLHVYSATTNWAHTYKTNMNNSTSKSAALLDALFLKDKITFNCLEMLQMDVYGKHNY